jgi:hypothetical protein
VLTSNQLTETGVALLRSTGVALEIGNQFGAEAIAHGAHLEGGDVE